MDTRVKILLVEDDEILQREYENYINEDNTFVLLGKSGSEQEAFEFFLANKSDVIILDLELAEGDGLHFIEKIYNSAYKPYIIIITNNRSESIYAYLRNKGADFICPKGNPSYTPDRVLDIIKMTYGYHTKIKEERETVLYNEQGKITYRIRSIRDELENMGFKESNLGSKYLVDAIYYKAFEVKNIDEFQITKDLYPVIAERYNTSVKNVEKNIRVAIERVWNKTELSRIERIYPFEVFSNNGAPSNLEFINNMSKKYSRL